MVTLLQLPLSGQVILITGAGKNLGRAVALEAAARGAAIGVNVRTDVESANKVADEIRALGSRAVVLKGDVSLEHDVNQMVAMCQKELGPISTVIHCAAYRSHKPTRDLSYDEWKMTFAVSLGGAHLLARSTLSSMTDSGFGRFIFIAGSSSVFGLPDGCAHVAASKSALRGFARSLAQEVGDKGVTANVVSPGPINSGGSRTVAPMGRWDPIRASALGRMATSQEVASLILYLCTPEAAIIQGQVIMADGGVFGFDD